MQTHWLTLQVDRRDFIAENLQTSYWEPPVQNVLSWSWCSTTNQLPFNRDKSRKQLLQAGQEEDKGEQQEAAMSQAAANKISVDADVAAVSSELDGIVALKVE